MINLNTIIVMFVISNIFLLYGSYNVDSNKPNLRKHNYSEIAVTPVEKLKYTACKKYLRNSAQEINKLTIPKIIHKSRKTKDPIIINSNKLYSQRLRKIVFGQYCINPNITINTSELVHLLF